jgi:hypothetical protein
MATTTPNFGWTVPTSTDLVKDGATAIETLGDSIDASSVDLKGGTTGQVLAKASGTDLDFSWVAQDDSNAIQNAIVDAKGDLIAATAADTPARLAVGTNGQILTADSTAATGIKWATPASSSFPAFSAYKSGGTQTLSNSVYTKITFATESFDTNSNYDTGTSRFTPTVSGYYEVNVLIDMAVGASSFMQAFIYKNGTIDQGVGAVWSVTEMYLSGSALIYFNGSSDYVEVYARGGSSPAVYDGATVSRFQAIGVRS